MPDNEQREPTREEQDEVGVDVLTALGDYDIATQYFVGHRSNVQEQVVREPLRKAMDAARHALIIAIAKRVREAEAMTQVYVDVAAERLAQDQQWGGPEDYSAHEWRNFRGVLEKRVLDMLESSHIGVYEPADGRSALIGIAALAIRQIEALDRKHPGLARTPEVPHA